MSDVKRYDVVIGGNDYSPETETQEDATGDFVLYDDHLAEMQKKDAEIAGLKATLKGDLQNIQTIAMLTEGRDKLFQATQDYIAKLTAQAKVIEKYESRLMAFCEYFEAIEKGEYEKNRPFLRDFEKVLLLRGREVLEAALTKQPEPKETPE